MPAKKIEEIKVVAELTLRWSGGIETIRTFDAAWHRAFELPVPVTIRFERFVRKD
jgi:hypothetical protein